MEAKSLRLLAGLSPRQMSCPKRDGLTPVDKPQKQAYHQLVYVRVNPHYP